MHENKTNSSEKGVGHDLTTSGDGIPRRERKRGVLGFEHVDGSKQDRKAGKDRVLAPFVASTVRARRLPVSSEAGAETEGAIHAR